MDSYTRTLQKVRPLKVVVSKDQREEIFLRYIKTRLPELDVSSLVKTSVPRPVCEKKDEGFVYSFVT